MINHSSKLHDYRIPYGAEICQAFVNEIRQFCVERCFGKRNYSTNMSYAMHLGLCCQAEGREGATEYYGFFIAVVQSFLFLTVIYVILKLFLNKHTVTGIVLKATFGGYFACPCQLPTYSLQRGVNATYVS